MDQFDLFLSSRLIGQLDSFFDYRFEQMHSAFRSDYGSFVNGLLMLWIELFDLTWVLVFYVVLGRQDLDM
jgi:hypothetical protein